MGQDSGRQKALRSHRPGGHRHFGQPFSQDAGGVLQPFNKGLSQEERAHQTDVHQTYISGVERGKRNPSVMVLAKIAAALDADLDDLTRRR